MRKSFSCFALLLLATSAVFAQTRPPPDQAAATPPGSAAPMHQHESIWALDANHDGILSRGEAQGRPGLVKHFDQIDTNHDGQIERNEWRAWHQQMKAKHQARMQQPQGAPPTSQPTQPPPDEDSSGV
ncbi:MAG: EF-hand domain-containing protein [Rhodanobacteraceae bacterium]|nr:EF-hand domain-containing protein [Pseudomonadota bacterium]